MRSLSSIQPSLFLEWPRWLGYQLICEQTSRFQKVRCENGEREKLSVQLFCWVESRRQEWTGLERDSLGGALPPPPPLPNPVRNNPFQLCSQNTRRMCTTFELLQGQLKIQIIWWNSKAKHCSRICFEASFLLERWTSPITPTHTMMCLSYKHTSNQQICWNGKHLTLGNFRCFYQQSLPPTITADWHLDSHWAVELILWPQVQLFSQFTHWVEKWMSIEQGVISEKPVTCGQILETRSGCKPAGCLTGL